MTTSTPFKKEDFSYHGGYLMYEGDAGSKTVLYPDKPGVHPTRVGTPKSVFVARFKYGSKPWKSYVNALVKNSTVEEMIIAYENGETPVEYLAKCGYRPRANR